MNEKINQDLKIGFIKEKEKRDSYITISEKSRYFNTAVVGLNTSDEKEKLIASFAKQQIQNGGNSTGCTFIVSGKEQAFFIASIAQRLKRKTQVKILKPSSDINTYKALIEDKEYNYDKMCKILDYKQEIRDKSIIIIDLEEFKYKEKSKALLRKILQHLYIDIQKTDKTLGRPHYLYIDDADEYIGNLKEILINGKDFNLTTTLFLNSISYLSKENQEIIENNVKNYIFMSNMSNSDTNYFSEKISNIISNINDFNNYEALLLSIKRSLNMTNNKTIHYCISKDDGFPVYGRCLLYNAAYTTEEEFESIANIAKKIKKKSIIADNNIPFKLAVEEFNKKYYTSIITKASLEEKNIKPKQNEKNIKEIVKTQDEEKQEMTLTDTIIENVNNIPSLYENETEVFDINTIIEEDINTKKINELNNAISDTEVIPKKKKKKKKKKKHLNSQIEENNEQTNNQTENIISFVEEPMSNKEGMKDEVDEIINIEETIEIEKSDTTISEYEAVEQYENFDDYNIVDDEPYLYEEEKAIIDEDNSEMIISIKRQENKERTIDDEFNETYEGFAEKVVEETENEVILPIQNEPVKEQNDTSKTYFDIDSLFDDEDE